MEGEKSTAVKPSTRRHTGLIVLIVVAVVLAVAIAVVAILQARSAKALGATIGSLQQEVQVLRESTDAKDRLMTDLIAKLEANIARVSESLKTLSDTDTKIQEELTLLRGDVAAVRIRSGLPSAAPAKGGSQMDLTAISQQELMAQLASLGDRIEKLKSEVILKETKILQDQITDTKGRIGKAEKDVKTLQNTLHEADLPSLKNRVTEVSVEVQQAEADVKALTKAHEAFRSQVTSFFQEVFYNDPWGKYVPQAQGSGK